jgi:C4-dicarboxylate-binding protein DctP
MRLHQASGAAIVALLLSASALGAEPKEPPKGPSQARELRVTVQLPPASMQTKNLSLFKQHVETLSKGALKISIFPSGQLFEDAQVIKAVVAGQVEIGASRIGHFTEAVPALGIFLLPFMFNVPAVEDAAVKAGSPVRGLLDRAVLEKTGARVLWWQPFGSFVLLSKAAPVASPAAMAGKTVRVFDQSSAALIKACTGTPVYLGAKEQYAGYKQGRAQIGQAAVPTIASWRFWEVMDTVTNTRHLVDALLIIISERLWQSLSEDHRRILEQAAGEAQKAYNANLRKIEAETYATAAKHGMKVIDVSRYQVDEWKACAAELLVGYLDRSGALGAKTLKGYRDILLETYRTHAPASRRREP